VRLSWQPALLRRKQPALPNRAEAICRLVEQGLEQAPRTGAMPLAKAEKAMEIASEAIDKVADKSLPAEEQQRRKRALIRGPKEFRDFAAIRRRKRGRCTTSDAARPKLLRRLPTLFLEWDALCLWAFP
jgi:hypothetical protein